MSDKETLKQKRLEIDRQIASLEREEAQKKLERERQKLGLKPCPHCGSIEVARYGGMSGWHDPYPYSEIICGNCGASSGRHGETERAIAVWNRRDEAGQS